VHASIVENLRAGAYIETAAAAAGVSASTVHAWLRRAEDHPDDCGSPFLEFLEAVEKARAEAELDAIRTIREAAPRSWQAAAWYLERSYPKRWGRQAPEPPPNLASDGQQPVSIAQLHALLVDDDE
jgi:transposase-like protein